jgi:hypothetical protein
MQARQILLAFPVNLVNPVNEWTTNKSLVALIAWPR